MRLEPFAVGGSPGRLGGDTGGSLPGQLDIGEIARALPRLWAPPWDVLNIGNKMNLPSGKLT